MGINIAKNEAFQMIIDTTGAGGIISAFWFGFTIIFKKIKCMGRDQRCNRVTTADTDDPVTQISDPRCDPD